MDKLEREEQSNVECGGTEDRNHDANNDNDFKNRYQRRAGSELRRTRGNREESKSHSTSSQSQREQTHSRSRSPRSSSTTRALISSNAFLNFVQDFRTNCGGMKSSTILQLAGKRWKQMSCEEKQPYVDAADSVKQQKQNKKVNEQKNKPTTSTEKQKSGNVRKVKATKEKKGHKKNTKSESNTESDTDTLSMTSGTGGTYTSGDISD